MVAAPQVGTTDSLVGLLHGTEIGPLGAIVSQETTRRLMNTMPFSYHLLPNSHYFGNELGSVFSPVIRFESGTSTSLWVATYGSEIKDTNKMYEFLRRDSGRTIPAYSDLLTPQVVDTQFLDYAQSIETLQASWQLASTTNLYQIAGTGIETPSSITYFTDQECSARSPLRLFACTAYSSKLGYRVNMTRDGDGTVVVPSALVKSSDSGRVERLWLDMEKYNTSGILGSNINRAHKDIFEVLDVINFIGNTIQSTTSRPYTYLSNTTPVLSSDNRLSFYLHSPLDMSIKLVNGNVLSSSTQTISGGIYRRYGELQYISLPDTSAAKTLVLQGTETGSFTLDIEQQKNGSTTNRQTYSAIPSSTSTKATVMFSNNDLLSQAVLSVDYDGNGITDVDYDMSGVVYNYVILKDAINGSMLKPIYKKILIGTVKTAESNYQKSFTKPQFKNLERLTLQVLKQTIIWYQKSKLLSPSESARLVEIINGLLNK